MRTSFERFDDCMQYRFSDRRPNHELGVWPQTAQRWREENPEAVRNFTWDWFVDEPALDFDRREFIPINYGMIPPFEPEVIEETPEYVVARDRLGIVTRALKAGTVNGCRMSMDQHLAHPVTRREDFQDIKRRLIPALPERYPPDLDAMIARWKTRDYPLTLGQNCAANGFYWRAREFMGTEALSFAFFEQPELIHEMMECYCELIIETSRPVLEKITVECFVLNEDFAMKSGPLLGPDLYREFIFPRLKRMVDFFRSHGVRHFAVDSDGDPTALIPLMMDAGVDVLWPIERAAGVSPMLWRKRFGRELRLWGGVDKRELAKGPEAIRAHLREFIPLIEEGGFIPTVDHTVPPDVSWDNFRHYMDGKMALLAGDFGKL
ncbi:MAG TPA: hypothetical protein ENN65_07765 [Candidatus Hydrogenedentes bacterium]|nr:hypothetical protein [Candidatus Hydrogenedentota bacterium]